MFRQRLASPDGAYDALNFLIDDNNYLFKRGGSAYHSDAALAPLLGLFDGYLAAGPRTLAWETTPGAFTLNDDDATFASVLNIGEPIDPFARGAVVEGMLWLPRSQAGVGCSPFGWGGSRIVNQNVTTPTITTTNGSAVITASGTSWSSVYEPGSLVVVTGGSRTFGFTAKSVDSNTQITLSSPWTDPGGSYATIMSNFAGGAGSAFEMPYVTSSGSPARLWTVSTENRVYYSPRGDAFTTSLNDYIDLPLASRIIGADSFRDTVIFFTTRGVWTVTNTELDPVDDYGNVQWQQQLVNGDLILWGDSGIAGWQQQLVVPALDDIYTLSPTGAVDSITQWTIRTLYRSYVAAGYRPGHATVSRGHYFLPIVNGTTLVDVLVARLDRPHLMSSRPRIWIFPWTRWAGHAASTAYVARSTTSGAPVLLAIQGERIIDVTATFDPSAANASDADGTTPACMVETNDFPTGGGLQPATVDRVRVVYELVAGGVTGDNFDRVDGDIGPNWTADPWIDGDDALVVRGHEAISDASNLLGLYRMWLNSTAFTGPPLAVQTTLIARPTTNQNSVTYSVLGFARDPASAGVFAGYEVRYRYEVAADTISIERWDGGSNRVRIYGPTAIPTRIAAGDILGFTIAAGGLLTATVNGTPVASIVDTTYFQDGAPAYAILGLADSVVGASAIAYDDFTVTIGAGIAVSSDQDGGSYTQLTNLGEQNGGTGWGLSDGSLYQWAKVTRKRNQVRFRITQAGACASFILRSVELLVRPGGKV